MGGVSIMGHDLDFVQTGILESGEGIFLVQLPARDETVVLQVERTKEEIYHQSQSTQRICLFFAFRLPHSAFRIRNKVLLYFNTLPSLRSLRLR
jgi:hypothetical protein